MSIAALTRRIQKLQAKHAPRDTRLPYLVMAECEAGTLTDYPGYEQHNKEHEALAAKRRLTPHVYIDFNPDDDGVDP